MAADSTTGLFRTQIRIGLDDTRAAGCTLAVAATPSRMVRATPAAIYLTFASFSRHSSSTAVSAWCAVRSGCSGVTDT
jgi:hypothetical protein